MSKKLASKKILMSLSLALGLTTGLSGCGQKSVDEHLSAARQYAQAQDIDAAIIEYKNAIQVDAQAPTPRYELGRLYLQKGEYASAEKELNRAMELGRPAGDVIPLLSIAYQRTGAENALADVDHRSAGMSAEESAEVGFYKLQAMANLDQKEAALALVSDLQSLETDSVYKGLIDSYEYILNEDFQAALDATVTLNEQSPDNKDVMLQLARLHLVLRQKDQAIAVYEDYVSQFPDDLTSKFALTGLLIEARELERAEPHVDELLKMNSSHGLLNQFKGVIVSSRGEHKEALKYLNRAIQNGRNDPVVRLVAGFSAYQMQNYEAASRHLSMVASQLPDNHPGLRMLADSLLQQGLSDDASSVLSRLGGGMRSDAALFSKAGFELLREGNITEAKKMIAKSDALSTSAEDLARLGVLQLSVNDIEGLVNLEEAAKKAPDSVMTQKTLMAAYIATNQLEKAKTLAAEWKDKTPDDPVPYLFLAEIATKQDDPKAARAALDEAAKIAPDNNRVVLAQARLSAGQENFSEARKKVNIVLQREPASIEALSLLYALAQQEGDPVEVIGRVSQELNKTPDNIHLRLLLARMQFANENIDSALATLSSIEADKQTPGLYWDLRGQLLLRQNKVDAATNHFQKWLEVAEQNKTAVLGLMLIYDAQNQYKKALDLAQDFLAKRNDTQIAIISAYLHAMLAEREQGRVIVNELSPEIKALPFVRGITARLDLLDPDSTVDIADAKAAYESQPSAKNMLLVVAGHESLGDQQAAFTFLKEHLAANPDDVQANMLYAERLIGRDNVQAQQAYEKVLKTMPDNFVVLNNLAYLYLQEGKLERAEKLAERAVEQQPDNSDAVDTLAQVYVKQNQPGKGLALYERIATKPIRSDEVYLNYVELLLQQDKTELGKRRLAERTFSAAGSQQRADKLKQTYNL